MKRKNSGISLADHLKNIQSKGGKAIVKKRGDGYMKELADKRWGKKKKKVKKEEGKEELMDRYFGKENIK